MYRRPERDLSTSVQYQMTGVAPDRDAVEMFFGTAVAPGGYAWLIPRGPDTVNVGLGIRRSVAGQGTTPREFLDRFVACHPVARDRLSGGRIVSRVAALIPVGGMHRRLVSGRVILAGDSAGLVMPTNGGGVPPALVSGILAGRCAALHVTRGTPLEEYSRRLRHEIGQELHISLLARHVADVVFPHDSLMELAMAAAGTRYLQDVIMCRAPGPLDAVAPLVVAVLSRTGVLSY